jgi:hypothetical protein
MNAAIGWPTASSTVNPSISAMRTFMKVVTPSASYIQTPSDVFSTMRR